MDGSDSAYEKHIRDRDGVVSLTRRVVQAAAKSERGTTHFRSGLFETLLLCVSKSGAGQPPPGPCTRCCQIGLDFPTNLATLVKISVARLDRKSGPILQ